MGSAPLLRHLTALALLIFILPAFAKSGEEITLFDSKQNVHPNYMKIIEGIKNGDQPTLVFHTPTGIKKYQVRKYLSRGAMTEVISVEGGKALLLPVKFGRDINLPSGTIEKMLGIRLGEYKMLRDDGVKTVKIFEDESIPERLIVAEEIHDAQDLNWVVAEMGRLKKVGTPEALAQYQHYHDELGKFVKSTWKYRIFGDLREGQILYGKNTGVVLADWDTGSIPVTYRDQGTIFSSDTQDMFRSMHQGRGEIINNTYASKLDLSDKTLQNELDQMIRDERAKHGMVDAPNCFRTFGKFIKSIFK